MKTTIYLQNSRPISVEDCRLDDEIQEQHVIICFCGREYATRLADFLDNSGGLRHTVRCIEYSHCGGEKERRREGVEALSQEEECRIDMERPRDMGLREFVSLIKKYIELFMLRYQWEAEVEDLMLY